ncbi:hypothetical protein [Pyrococcus horikoshii]|nr:hypothetical protein [Pyrococcus horikoshii]HII61168.1 hypothetical protein [Pyrococcus horikoshii]
MRIEVPSKEYLSELSKRLSKAGIMNKPKEELDWEINHMISLRKKFNELKNLKIESILERLSQFENVYSEIMGKLRTRELNLEEISDEPLVIEVLEALVENNCVEFSDDGKIKLLRDVPLEELEIELSVPADEVLEDLENLERVGGKLVTEVKLLKRYYVEIMEVELEAIQRALDIAEEYVDEEALLESAIAGIAKSALSQLILSLVKDIRKKDELIDLLLSSEPIEIGGEHGDLRIYFEEEALEDLLKELQTLGYLKVKGNRIWFY